MLRIIVCVARRDKLCYQGYGAFQAALTLVFNS